MRKSICHILMIMLFAVVAQGQPMFTPLHIGSAKAIRDEQGNLLKGNSANPDDLIQVLQAPDGIIYPPLANGYPDPRNPVIAGGVTRIGALTSGKTGDSGLFSHSIVDGRPGNGEKIFVRAYNAPWIHQATFYGDSKLRTVNDNKVIEVAIDQTDQPIYTQDVDGDGLVDSWEYSLGTDTNSPDTDSDGMSDGDEKRAGTDALSADSLLAISSYQPYNIEMKSGKIEPGWGFELYWPSVAGKSYRVQFTSNSLDAALVSFVDISDTVTATGDTASVYVSAEALYGEGSYRVRLVD